jgi:hypothetical protein
VLAIHPVASRLFKAICYLWCVGWSHRSQVRAVRVAMSSGALVTLDEHSN